MREFIKNFIQLRNLSLNDFSKRLCYKSKTSLMRMMDENVREQSVYRFQRELKRAFSLSAQEEAALREAVQMKLYGEEKMAAFREMDALMLGTMEESEENQTILAEDVQSGAWEPLFQKYETATELQIIIVNCGYMPVYRELTRLLKCDVRIKHYCCIDRNDARTIHMLRMTMPVLHQQGYELFLCDSLGETQPNGMALSDVMVCTYRRADGVRCEDMIVCDGENHAWRETSAGEPMHFFQLLGLHQDIYVPVKKQYENGFALEDYIGYSEYFASLEQDRAILKIKPDIGIEYIKPQILKNAILQTAEIEPKALETFEQIYNRRYRNAYDKRRHTHMLIKWSAMRQFALTGKTSDHFWGLRPFTPEERIEILMEMQENARHNHFFHLYFLKNDSAMQELEIDCYGERGMMIAPAHTNYSFPKGHNEVMLPYRHLIDLFKEFFFKELLPKQAQPENSSVEILEGLLTECRRMCLSKRKKTS